MLTGDKRISKGDAWIRGFSLKTNQREARQLIGYCPQFDALIDDLTGRETLKFFASARGVPPNRIDDITRKLSSDFNFEKHLDKQVRAYSGGNKRKLSTAVALLGNPAIVFLDEPTTGMDPGAKRKLWDVLCHVRDSGKTIVLTSHSMEECEALCTRLVRKRIMQIDKETFSDRQLISRRSWSAVDSSASAHSSISKTSSAKDSSCI